MKYTVCETCSLKYLVLFPNTFPLYLVIEAESQFGHSREIDTHLDKRIQGVLRKSDTETLKCLMSHLDVSPDLRPEDLALGAGQQVHALYHVQEHLVLTILDTFMEDA